MIWRLICASTLSLLTACGGGGGGGSSEGSSPDRDPVDNAPCEGQCATADSRLTEADVRRVLAQGVHQAEALGANATLAVVDRVGNVLAVYRMAGVDAGNDVELATDFPVQVSAGLEGVVLPVAVGGDALAAIAKALTGAYLSSEGNAFSTRTANQIVQEHFNPGERNQPAGPLFGVQFSQLACSDFTQGGVALGPGPRRSPLGLSADPGGFPLYKDGTPVGGVGVIADGRYSIDKNLLDTDRDLDEQIAFAATFGYTAPVDRRASRITVEGKVFRFSDVGLEDLPADPAQAPGFETLQGALLAVPGYSTGQVRRGTAFGQPESGIRPSSAFAGLDAFEFVDVSGNRRFAPRAGTDAALLGELSLNAAEVRELLRSAIGVANRARAQIRRPVGTPARVTVSIVDSQGAILGMLRTRDAPIFGADVSLQKARTAVLFSSPDAADFLRGIDTPTQYLNPDLSPAATVNIADYVDAAQLFIGPQALTDGTAFSDRAGGNLSRPFYPDGIIGNPHGPFSKDYDSEWSVFSTGLQLDLSFNNIIAHIAFVAGLSGSDVGNNCVQSEAPRVANGIQIFPGSVPIYRGETLVGGIGVSGDGIDQDDMIAFLGVHEAGEALGGAINNAPPAIRADQLTPGGERLRYIQCPQTPFINSDAQHVCAGK
ncbi:MAG: hypothetical protein CME40_05750 [Haliea sp.]|nr:hypothetical protein [Haliea sp.]|tara:strand:+ start:25460 stop:27433 length:1974 start_codon:yes stop_codon:yes gene_type:complete